MSPAVVPGELGSAACFRERERENQIARAPRASLFFSEFWLGGMQVLSGNDAGEKQYENNTNKCNRETHADALQMPKHTLATRIPKCCFSTNR